MYFSRIIYIKTIFIENEKSVVSKKKVKKHSRSNAGWILQKSKLTQANQKYKDTKCDKTISFFVPCQKQPLSLIKDVGWLSKLKEKVR